MPLCSLPVKAAHPLQVAVPRAGGSCRARGHITASAAGASAASGDSARSAWVEKCLRRAQQTAILVDGVPFMPLAEVGHCLWGWFGRGQAANPANQIVWRICCGVMDGMIELGPGSLKLLRLCLAVAGAQLV